MEQDPRALYNDELYRQWRDSRSDWDTEARKDIDFYLGNHFTADESDELASRNQADIPMDRVSAAIEKFKAVFPLVTKDFIKMMIGLGASVGVVLAIHYVIVPNGL